MWLWQWQWQKLSKSQSEVKPSSRVAESRGFLWDRIELDGMMGMLTGEWESADLGIRESQRVKISREGKGK